MQTIELDGAQFVVSSAEQARRPFVVYGPLPLVAGSPLLLRIRPIRGSDRRAVRAGVARRVESLEPALDAVAFIETELDDASARALLPSPALAPLARAVGTHGAVVRVRRDFAHVEISPRRKDGVSPSEVSDLVGAVAALSRAARSAPPGNTRPLADEGSWLVGAVVVLSILGVIGGYWALAAARLVWPGDVVVVAVAVLTAVAVFAGGRGLLRRIGRPSTTSHRTAFDRALAAALASGVVALVVLPTANRHLDTSEPVAHEATVVSFGYGKSGNLADVRVQRERDEPEWVRWVPMTDLQLGKGDVGKRVVLRQRRGALGLGWIERIEGGSGQGSVTSSSLGKRDRSSGSVK